MIANEALEAEPGKPQPLLTIGVRQSHVSSDPPRTGLEGEGLTGRSYLAIPAPEGIPAAVDPARHLKRAGIGNPAS